MALKSSCEGTFLTKWLIATIVACSTLRLNFCRDVSAGNCLNQFHYSIPCWLVILVWTTDLVSFRLIQGVRSTFFECESWYSFWCYFSSCHLLLYLQLMHDLIIKTDTVVLGVSSVFTVLAGDVRLQHPISTTCQLEASLYWVLWDVFGCSFMVIVLTTLVMASNSWLGLNKYLSFWFSWRVLFNSDLTTAISVAWASILFYHLQELWDKCWSGKVSL